MLTTTDVLSSAASTGSLSSISSHFAVTLRPEVQFVGEVLDPASDTVGVSILLITNLPSLSVEQSYFFRFSSSY